MSHHATVAEKLRKLARNLWWSWQPGVISLFEELDPKLWYDTDHNPIALLDQIAPEQLERRADEMALHSRIDSAFGRLSDYVDSDQTWGRTHTSSFLTRPVAYFSMEFGLHESLPIYSGGLGVLAGDHLKSASDLGIPLVACGLLYNQGYFHQSLDQSGWQQESYTNADTERLPIVLATDKEGREVRVAIDSHSGTLHARVWRVGVGRTTLLLLDSNVPENSDWDRGLTSRLYGGDGEVRIRQELLLGVGGMRALRALGYDPSVLHLNEGHSAFVTLEAIRERMHEEGKPFGEVRRDVAAMTVFTTHTPVAAGHDRFDAEQVERHLGRLREDMHLSYDDLMGLGRIDPHDHHERFCMTVLALKLSEHANGVSALHGRVSREMWNPLYPGRDTREIPIGHITNGVHVLSWLAPPMREIYDRHLEPNWHRSMEVPEVFSGIRSVDEGMLWETHQRLKARLLDFLRRRLVIQAERRGEDPSQVEELRSRFGLDILTIGFARRFATYKRAGLVLREPSRLADLINASDRPVQIVFAGKAHPEDRQGKELIQSIVEMAKQEPFRNRIVFIEDYDMNVARYLVQGVDVWLNNPRRPQEASGTSGQKAALNGVLNCSILDGWWAEAYDGANGFAIGSGRSHTDMRVQDERDHAALIETLAEQVIPKYYERDESGLPRRWIASQKAGIQTLGWRFNSDRMVMDYALNSYLPAAGKLTYAAAAAR